MRGVRAKMDKKNPRSCVVCPSVSLLAAGFPSAVAKDQIIEVAACILIRHSDITLLSYLVRFYFNTGAENSQAAFFNIFNRICNIYLYILYKIRGVSTLSFSNRRPEKRIRFKTKQHERPLMWRRKRRHMALYGHSVSYSARNSSRHRPFSMMYVAASTPT